ncbi:MAG: hypothetical protein AB7H86_01325 [Blastocatellales bacterium]
MRKILLIPIAIGMLIVAAAGQQAEVVTVLKGNDPIELVEGREVAGSQSLSVVRGRYRYIFANDANRKKFVGAPDRYQIQNGGGCGQMGSLSGAGNPDRYYVFDGRIYIFASEQCRNAFKADPKNHIEGPDAVPGGTAAEKKRGAELIALALRGMGGAKAVDGVKKYRENITLGYSQGGKITEYKQTLTYEFPGRYRNEYDWGSSTDAMELVPGRATSISSKGEWIREEPVRAAMERELYRNPLAILKARRSPGFVAVGVGAGKLGETMVEYLKVAYHGATTTLAIDTATGHILQAAFRDRKGAYGEIVRSFSDFREVSGLIVPFGIEDSFNGKPVRSSVVRLDSVTVN